MPTEKLKQLISEIEIFKEYLDRYYTDQINRLEEKIKYLEYRIKELEETIEEDPLINAKFAILPKNEQKMINDIIDYFDKKHFS